MLSGSESPPPNNQELNKAFAGKLLLLSEELNRKLVEENVISMNSIAIPYEVILHLAYYLAQHSKSKDVPLAGILILSWGCEKALKLAKIDVSYSTPLYYADTNDHDTLPESMLGFEMYGFETINTEDIQNQSEKVMLDDLRLYGKIGSSGCGTPASESGSSSEDDVPNKKAIFNTNPEHYKLLCARFWLTYVMIAFCMKYIKDPSHEPMCSFENVENTLSLFYTSTNTQEADPNSSIEEQSQQQQKEMDHQNKKQEAKHTLPTFGEKEVTAFRWELEGVREGLDKFRMIAENITQRPWLSEIDNTPSLESLFGQISADESGATSIIMQ
ncbi:hypothetical protein H4219_002860 [Mycoemilia scoparia]|uniref:Uncharacterized protein n=1 Tax=Mycoemilia scoparia TaxID=417184 RepID=A0A9W8A1I8_9FUNG|nr:hypothetical protein H4219_002860 [Mycoemilia scoparia]